MRMQSSVCLWLGALRGWRPRSQKRDLGHPVGGDLAALDWMEVWSWALMTWGVAGLGIRGCVFLAGWAWVPGPARQGLV